MIQIAFIILSLLLLELLIHFVVFPIKFGRPYYRLVSRHWIYRYHPLIGYEFVPNLRYSNPTPACSKAPRFRCLEDVRTDNYGFLTTEDLEDLKDQYKLIFCIGGSSTAALEVPTGQSYPAQLDLLTKPLGYRCINAGVPGYRSIHELLNFKHKILQHGPSAIIIFSGYNDFKNNLHGAFNPHDPFAHVFSYVFPRYPLISRYLNRLATYHTLQLVYSRIKRGIVGAKDSLSFSDILNATLASSEWLIAWKAIVSEIIEVARQHDVEVYILSHMVPVYKGASPEAIEYSDRDLDMSGCFQVFAEFHEILRRESEILCSEKKISFLDVAKDFDTLCAKHSGAEYYKRRFNWFMDTVHPTREGNELLARLVFDQLQPKLRKSSHTQLEFELAQDFPLTPHQMFGTPNLQPNTSSSSDDLVGRDSARRARDKDPELLPKRSLLTRIRKKLGKKSSSTHSRVEDVYPLW